MAVQIRKPNIIANNEREMLEQIRVYLYQMSDQLNWAFDTIESGTTTNGVQLLQPVKEEKEESKKVETNFNEIKALIIKSADIVNAYYDKISKKLEGEYSALSDFGDFKQTVSAYFEANPTEALVKFENLQAINSTLEKIGMELDKVIKTDATIKAGLTGYDEDGAPVYGLEIWQRNEHGDETVFEQFARLSANKLSFYDNNDAEVAYISDYMLYITNAAFVGTVKVGGYKYDTSDGIAHVWEGRG